MRFIIKNLVATASIVACGAVMSMSSASAAPITEVFSGLDSPAISCEVQGPGANAGQRWCDGSPARVKSFDGTPIDVMFAMPPVPASGPDGNFPVVGTYHGWGGQKAGPGSGNVQGWLDRGYAVFSMTDRGWFKSCGTNADSAPAWGTCANGYVHLIDQRWEVRDAQYLLGVLADNGAINPQETAANGGSYGGMMSLQLGMLNDRVKLPDGTYAPWTSPVNHYPMRTTAAVPQNLASDLAYALIPNGSMLDYVAKAPYFGPNDDLRVGLDKTQVSTGLYTGGLNKANFPAAGMDPTADMTNWFSITAQPGPYDTDYAKGAIKEIGLNHSAYGIDDSTAPAPMLMSAGYRDDFVPTSETIRMYNKIRADHPSTPVSLFFSDQGHARSGDKKFDAQTGSDLRDAWLDYYVLGQGSKPDGGVTTMSMTCPATPLVPSAGPFHFSSWADMQKGEIRVRSLAAKTISATGSQYGDIFSKAATDACASADATDNPATANYRTPAAPTGGYTLAGPATVLANLNVTGPSDQVISRLLDVGPDGQERLLERGILRPKMDGGAGRQVFQLHPNFVKVEEGHVLKLELLPDDAPYSHTNVTTPDAAAQHPIEVTNLEMRIPTSDSPGAAGGLVKKPAAKILPAGYTLSSDFAEAPQPDSTPPETLITKGPPPATTSSSAAFDFSSETGATFECRLDSTSVATWAPCASPTTRGALALGRHTFNVRAIDTSGNVDPSPASRTFVVAKRPRTIRGHGMKRVYRSHKRRVKVTMRFRSSLGGSTFQCRVDRMKFSRCRSPKSYRLRRGKHVFQVRALRSGLIDMSPVKVKFRIVKKH